MASRRMFAMTIIDSDAFIDMPASARLLYFDLGMRADDDGFVNAPKKIIRFTGASEDDLKILIAKKFIIPFDSGVVVIKHWNINNTIRKDRYSETKYKAEKAALYLDENNAYSLHPQENWLTIKNDNQLVDNMATQISIDQDSTGKNSLVKEIRSVVDVLSDADFTRLCESVTDMTELMNVIVTVNAAGLKAPYNYCVTVARNMGLLKEA